MTEIRKVLAAVALMVASVAMAEIDLPSKVSGSKVVYYYEVPPKETIYSITRKFGVTREELLRLNPQLIDGLRAGTTLVIKEVEVGEVVEPLVDPAPVLEPEVEEVSADTISIVPAVEPTPALTPQPVAADSDAVNIAIMLPFMLDSEAMTRTAQNQTNFYRGAMLALELAGEAAGKVNIYAYDTEGSADVVAGIISKPDIANIDFIVAPGDSLSIERIAAVADTTGATVLNFFAVKNDAHQRHSSVMQMNIPHKEMYDSAIRGFIAKFKGKKVLILNATDIPADKQAFVSALTTELVHSGIPFEKIDYAGKLSAQELEMLPARDYVVVPTAGSREALMKILPALNEVGQSNPAMSLRLFGYPEWVVLRGEIKDNLHRLNALVYSRFSTDLDGPDVEKVSRAYTKWYGTEPTPSFPDTMLLGFDAMGWILHSAANGMDNTYRGLQNSFTISEVPDGGDVNTALYFITFEPDGHVAAESF